MVDIEQGGIHFCYEQTYVIEDDTWCIYQSVHIEPSIGIIRSGLLDINELKEVLDILREAI